MNTIQIFGNIGTDIEKITFDNGQIAKFSIASNSYYKTNQGDKVEKTTWLNCEVRGKAADFFENSVNKGDAMIIFGSLEQHFWEKDGIKNYNYIVKVENFRFAQKKQ